MVNKDYGEFQRVTGTQCVCRDTRARLEAFTVLYEANRRRVFSLCLRMVHSYETCRGPRSENICSRLHALGYFSRRFGIQHLADEVNARIRKKQAAVSGRLSCLALLTTAV